MSAVGAIQAGASLITGLSSIFGKRKKSNLTPEEREMLKAIMGEYREFRSGDPLAKFQSRFNPWVQKLVGQGVGNAVADFSSFGGLPTAGLPNTARNAVAARAAAEVMERAMPAMLEFSSPTYELDVAGRTLGAMRGLPRPTETPIPPGAVGAVATGIEGLYNLTRRPSGGGDSGGSNASSSTNQSQVRRAG